MRNHVFIPSINNEYQVVLLLKNTAFKKDEIEKNYLKTLNTHGLSADKIVALTLEYNDLGKAPVKHIKDYLINEILPVLNSIKAEYIYCADSAFFKVLVGDTKADTHAGYILPCKLDGFTNMQVVLGLNYQQLIYNPALQEKLDTGLFALASHVCGGYQAPGTGIIKQAIYPSGIQAIQDTLEALMDYPELASDIEAFSLRFHEAGIGTIAFAPDKHNFVAFPCDYAENTTAYYDAIDLVSSQPVARTDYGRFAPDPAVRAALKKFFTEYKGKLTWHSAAYDVKVIIYTLWMKDGQDTEGLLEGLHIMYRVGAIDDTKIIAYLATNSTAGNTLGLKALAQEFAGNWAKDDIKDIKKIPLKELLQYNGVDCLSTNYVKDKYYPVMVVDKQEELYHTLMLPSQKMLTQVELTGMPMNRAKIDEIEVKLTEIDRAFTVVVMANPIIKRFEDWKTKEKWQKDFEDRKAKAKNPDRIKPKSFEEYPQFEFNPGSPDQLQDLLFHNSFLSLPIIDTTDTGLPSTGEKTLKKLLDHPDAQPYKELIEAIIGIAQVSTILSTFIPAFKRAIDRDASGIVWLHGNFNIGGTVSGRLSSSDPNLQNIPAKSIFAKLIKEAFMGPEGWLFCGADFNSLEDMISALTTKDPNKLKVYTDGFDGHCLRAAYYYRDQLLHVDLADPDSVNQLAKTHPELRQESKTPTFALTYQGTWITLVANLGWTKEKAQKIEASYHEMYSVSDQYVQSKLLQASQTGYVEVAFGLRVRTPILKQVVYGAARMPKEAAAEGRTAGNALGQSYGLLNNRAMVAFMEKVWASPYKLDIKPCSLIHDAGYLLVREDVEVLEFANRELIAAMQWQNLPDIQHPTVKLGAALDVFWPSWANAITIPNNATQEQIITICTEGKHKYLNPKPKEK